MKRARICALLVLFCSPAVSAPQQTEQSKSETPSFKELLDEASMTFTMPADFSEAAVVENEDVSYHFAVVSNKMKLQIRYVIRPLRKDVENYDNGGRSGPDPNVLFGSLLQVMCLNITGGTLATPTDFRPDDVRSEFGADAGRTAFVTLNSTFGKGYKVCLINVIHRSNIADAFIFFLFDDIASVQSTCFRDDVFHALKFK